MEITKQAQERNETVRSEYMYRMTTYTADQLVFVDESACDRRTTYRGVAWALKGERAYQKAVFVRGTRCVLHKIEHGLTYDSKCLLGIQFFLQFRLMACCTSRLLKAHSMDCHS